jgi:hypothetical protein
MKQMTKAERLVRVRQIADAARKHAGVPSKARLQAGVDAPTVTTMTAPADGDDVSSLVDATDIDSYLTAPKWVKHCSAEGAIVTLYFETLASDGEYELDTVAVGWIGTVEAPAVLMQVDGRLAIQTLDLPAQPEPAVRRTTPVAPAPIDTPSVAMTRAEIIDEFNTMLDQFGLRDRGWTASINTRMTRTYGICRYGPRRVEVSWPIARLNGRAETMNTIAHEVAHAIAGPGAGHGPKWKDACALTGARPERCYSGDEVATPKGRYVATCAACGADCGSRNRAPKPVTYYHRPSACKGYVRGTKNNAIVWTDTRSAR